MALRCVALLALVAAAQATGATPISKVLDLISGLQAKVVAEGEAAQKAYAEFAEWCEDRSKRLEFEIKTGKDEMDSLTAAIAENQATIGSLTAKVDELGDSIAVDDSQLKDATAVRAKEAEDFAAEKAELEETIDTLERAIALVAREMAKTGGASLMQGKKMGSLAQVVSTMLEASMLSSADARRLTAMVQSSHGSEDAEIDAPAAAVYTSQSGNIKETLEGLWEQAKDQHAAASKKETSALHAFAMLKQSLDDSMKFANADMSEAKASLTETATAKATNSGELDVTTKDHAADTDTLADLHANCLSRSEDFEASTNSRGEELKALAEAKKVLVEATGGAGKIMYGLAQTSFLQKQKDVDSGVLAALRHIRELARKVPSTTLTQLASRVDAAMGSRDPFAKVKGLIGDMIGRLEAEAAADATEKAFCDKEIAKATEKHDAKTSEIAKQTAKINQMAARSAMLKDEVAELQKALADIAATQAEMTKLRNEQHETFVTTKADLELGLDGVKTGLKILREYYAKEDKAHTEAAGTGSSIIGLLEVVEADFTKGLANTVASEESAASAYTKESKENEVETTAKNQDVKYKTKESNDLDKSVSEYSTDRTEVQAELDAVNEYLDKLDKRCSEVAETYESRKAHREAEIAGLKEALTILEEETALLQRAASRRKGLRSYVIAADGAAM